MFTSHLMFVNKKCDMKTNIKQDMNTITHLLISAAAHAHSVSVFQYKKGRGVSPSAYGARYVPSCVDYSRSNFRSIGLETGVILICGHG